MSSRTVSLERSAYERLRAAKRPGESFSGTVNRLLEGTRPTFRSLAGFLSPTEARAVREAIARMRALESKPERRGLRSLVESGGSHPRH